MKLDIEFVRTQFPQLEDEPDFVFCSNAGGSYVARPVIEQLDRYNRHLRVQPYNKFQSSREAGLAMDRARACWSEALNISADELTIGPSTSINSYVMAQAAGAGWGPGDEIVVTQQDHEANHGVWRRMAEARGTTVREWRIDPVTGLLDPEDLFAMLGERTRWVFFSHCSNIIGTVNPVAEIVSGVRQRSSARVCVDAVAYAPHHICDLKALDVDMYLFSLYKVFGPHQGLLYVRSDLFESLVPQCHFFNVGDVRKRFNPAGPQHAQVAVCAGVMDYFDALYRHHDGAAGAPASERMQYLHTLIGEHEADLAGPLLDYLHHSKKARLLGKTDLRDRDRAATIAFQPLTRSSGEVVAAMQALGIGTEFGHFYAYRALTNLGIEPGEGIVRISLVHYNTSTDVERILAALDTVLA